MRNALSRWTKFDAATAHVQEIILPVSNRAKDGVGHCELDLHGSPLCILNLVRWVSPRTIKETFAPARSYEYPFLAEK
jgi:hypothetical protein